MDLPGVAENDIEVSVHPGTVTVAGETSFSRKDKGDTWFFGDRQYGSFIRSFRVPADAQADKVDAHLKDAVLTTTIPKRGPGGVTSVRVPIRKG